jgi:HSP20 family protein
MVTRHDAMDRLFEDSVVRPFWGWPGPFAMAEPALDVMETDDAVIVKASLPGVKPEEVDVSITGDTLTLKGKTKSESEVKDANYLCRERRYGTFTRSVALPEGLKGDKTEATFENGVLTLSIPKSEQIKPKSIKVKVKK